jgi:hypothetical protein
MTTEQFTPGRDIQSDQSFAQIMQRMTAVIQSEIQKLTLVAKELEAKFGTREPRLPDRFFAIQASKQLQYALEDFPEAWCNDPVIRYQVVRELKQVFQ